MWIVLMILGIIVLLLGAVLLLPLHLIVKNDENNNLLIRYRVLGKTYGEIPKPETDLAKSIKQVTGISRAEEQLSRKKILEDTIESVKELCNILGDFLGELTSVLRHCTAKVFRVRVVVAKDNAADTAIAYGKASMLVYGLSAVASNLMRVRKRGRELEVRCDFDGGEKELRYEFVIMVRAYSLLFALVRMMRKEADREKAKKEPK